MRPIRFLEIKPYVHDALLETHVSVCAITRGRNCAYKEGIDKWIGHRSNDVPIEGGEGVQPQTGYAAGNRSEFNVLRGNPSDPVEVRHRLEDVVGEPEVDEHGDKTVREPPHPGDRPAVDYVVGLSVEGAVEGNSRQVGGPDSLGRIDKESTG